MSHQNSPSAPASIRLANAHFEILLRPGSGIDCTVTHLPTGQILTQGPYFYSFGPPAFTQITHDSFAITCQGVTESGLEITHILRLPANAPWLEEEIVVRNQATAPFSGEIRCGFTLPAAPGTLDGYTFTAVPFRREPLGDRSQYADYRLEDILHKPRLSMLRSNMNWITSFNEGVHETGVNGAPIADSYSVYASEGWVLTNGTTGFLLTKYNPRAMEWAVLDSGTVEANPTLRWGGAGIYCGDPEPAVHLASGESFRFGTTRLTAFAGDVTQGFYTFRREMESRGHAVPADFDPPLHWNELYDNPLWWLPNHGYNIPQKRRELYQLKDMEEEAAKAKAIGCEALYLDPGWDVTFASKIWDESRLGKMADFVELMKSKYGLKVSLHAPLSGWCDPSSYPPECGRVDEQGRRNPHSLCGASFQYVEETTRRFDELAACGACFFMFDGSAYNGPCWDPQHGHPVPSGRHEHVLATNRIAYRVHEKNPKVLIEMHDQIIGPRPLRYVPTYLGHGKDAEEKSSADGFDTIWAYELMWDPMQNLGQGNSVCLYYYNLAYSQPLYVHIDLRTDNAEAVMFWWNASTCRHLGIGGTHPDAAVREIQKKAVGDYIRLKPHFTAGTFYGLDETTHVHRHPTASTAVINCFNLDSKPIDKTIEFNPARFDLPSRPYRIVGADLTPFNEGYRGTVTIPAMGHRLIEVY